MEIKSSNHGKIKKKVVPIDRELNGSIFMLRCCELGLSKEDLEGMTMGMVFDILTEQSNDHEKYEKKPAPGGMKSFFAGGGKIG